MEDLYPLSVVFKKTMRLYRNLRGVAGGIRTGKIIGAATMRVVLNSKDNLRSLTVLAKLPRIYCRW
jgi:hypothetical protein